MGEKLDLSRFKKKVVEQKTVVAPKAKADVAPARTDVIYVLNVHCQHCVTASVRSDQMLVGYTDKEVILTCSSCGLFVAKFDRK